MFIQESDTIDVVIFYRKIGRTYLSYNEKEFNETIKDDKEKEKYKKLTVTMKLLTWGLNNELQDLAWITDPKDENKNIFSRKKYKEEKFKKLIVKWDATTKDKDGKEVPAPVTNQLIMSLSPNMAETILNTYDELSMLSDEEEGK